VWASCQTLSKGCANSYNPLFSKTYRIKEPLQSGKRQSFSAPAKTSGKAPLRAIAALLPLAKIYDKIINIDDIVIFK
jgi:hypothetical protein